MMRIWRQTMRSKGWGTRMGIAYRISRQGTGLDVSRAPSKLRIGSESNKYPNREPRKEDGCTGGRSHQEFTSGKE